VIALKTGACWLHKLNLLQLTAKLAQQANSLSSVEMLWLTAHCFAAQTGYYKRKPACFYRQHCPLEACLPMALACCCAANLPSADNRFPRSTHSQGQSSAASATDDICCTGPTYTRVRWFTRPTASQIELSSHTNCSAKQGVVLDADF
jgi:hypothetical protein